MAIARTVFSPRCCATSSTSLISWPSTAVTKRGGMGQKTRRSRRVVRAVVATAEVRSLRRSTRTFESGHDGGQFAVELHVDDGTDHLGHAAIGGRVRRRRGGEPAREGGLRFDNTARDGALRLAHFRKAPGQPRPGNPGRGGPKSLPGEASGDTRETSHDDDVTEISTSPRGVLARPTLRSGREDRGFFHEDSIGGPRDCSADVHIAAAE